MNEATAPATTPAAILGAVLAHLRKEQNLTQDALGKAVGVGATTWSRIEQGSSQLSTDQLRAAAKALGVQAAFVLQQADTLEEELKAKGVVVGDVPPKKWGDAASKGIMDDLQDHFGVIGAVASSLLIPLAGAALAGLVKRYWPQESDASQKSEP